MRTILESAKERAAHATPLCVLRRRRRRRRWFGLVVGGFGTASPPPVCALRSAVSRRFRSRSRTSRKHTARGRSQLSGAEAQQVIPFVALLHLHGSTQYSWVTWEFKFNR